MSDSLMQRRWFVRIDIPIETADSSSHLRNLQSKTVAAFNKNFFDAGSRQLLFADDRSTTNVPRPLDRFGTIMFDI